MHGLPRRLHHAARAAATGLFLSGCYGHQSVLDPAGAGARRIADLWWLMLIVATAVFLVVIGLATYAVLKRGRPTPERMESDDARSAKWVAVGAGTTLTILIAFLLSSFWVARENRALHGQETLVIEVTGHQWWWEVRYKDRVPSRIVRTANEIHLPVDRPVLLELSSRDVIHSLWVPNLGGKLDLVPGRTNRHWLKPERTGVFRGQCAEFCGIQHARMGLVVVVESDEDFADWLTRQRRPAAFPEGISARRGLEVFRRAPCGMCHTIRGTDAGGTAGPDLTHFGSRRMLAAGTLPNNRGNLGSWLVDAQRVKPGNHMPNVKLAAEDLQALLSYLTMLD